MPEAHPAADPIEFTDRDVRLIIASLEGKIYARRRELLPMLLQEWAATDLQEHLTRESPERIAQRLERLEAIAQHYADAANLVESLDARGLTGLASTMASSPDTVVLDAQRYHKAAEAIRQEPERLRQMAVAARDARRIWKRGRGRPRNLPSYLILRDLAAIYEWLVRREASRTVSRTDHGETGPFWDFASAVWPVVFGSDDGLSYGLRSWAEARQKYGESSPLIANMYLRHPEWRLFDD
jgi:hypothetical protein